MDYSEIYARYYGKISKYLGGIVGPLEAEDVAQEVFIKAGNSLDQLKDPSKLAPWLFEIALNTARDRIRSRLSVKSGKDRLILQSEEPLEKHDSKSRNPEEILEYSSMVECYLGFVKDLPKTYSNVYVLSEIEGFSDKEISKRLSLPLQTVKMRLHRARNRLYKQLRTHCRCYCNERGEIMADLKSKPSAKRFKV
jgi:RNA polymerase sigma-70 factor (ECF subfamily)